MKVLIVDNSGEGCGLDLAVRAQNADHDVRFWLPPFKGGLGDRPYGQGMVERIKDWKPLMSWAELIVLTGNTDYMHEFTEYFGKGFPIFGTNPAAAKLETDRELGQKVLEEAGVETLPYTIVGSAMEAEELVVSTGKAYAIKPWGGESDKSLTYVSSSPDDALFTLHRWQKEGKLKGQLMFQEKIDGIEIGISGMFGPGGWCKALEESFEHKKFLNEDLGENCYAADTEVLTKRGWLTFDQVTLEDDVASFNPEDSSIFFERPAKIHWADYSGPMYEFKNRYVDLLVTPTHNVWAARRKTNSWKMYPANECPSEFDVLQAGYTKEPGWKDFILPGCLPSGTDLRIKAEIWLPFLALYLSEGSSEPDRGRVTISQTVKGKKAQVRTILKKLPWDWLEYENGFVVTFKALAEHLSQFGDSHRKYIPDYVKAASAEQIELFLTAYCIGDGDFHNGRRRYCSGSYQTISDIQELMLRVGKTGVISTDNREYMISPVSGKTYEARPVYSIEEATRNKVSLRERQVIDYEGKIGCVTLRTTHLLFVRRNQRVVISGNTGEMGTVIRHVVRSKLFDKVLEPVTDYLHRINYVGDCSVNCMVDRESGTPWPLEFTMRLGWPDFCIRQALIQDDPVEWMVALVNGEDKLRVSPAIAVGVCLTHGDFPRGGPADFRPKDPLDTWVGYPIYGVTSQNEENIHWQQAMEGMTPMLRSGKVEQVPIHCTAGNYMCVCTGTGGTVETAAARAYRLAWSLKVPSNLMFRTDIGKRLELDLFDLQKFGFAKGMRYRDGD